MTWASILGTLLSFKWPHRWRVSIYYFLVCLQLCKQNICRGELSMWLGYVKVLNVQVAYQVEIENTSVVSLLVEYTSISLHKENVLILLIKNESIYLTEMPNGKSFLWWIVCHDTENTPVQKTFCMIIILSFIHRNSTQNMLLHRLVDCCFLSISCTAISPPSSGGSSRHAGGRGGDGGGDAAGRGRRHLLHYQLSSWRKEVGRTNVSARSHSHGESPSTSRQVSKVLTRWCEQNLTNYSYYGSVLSERRKVLFRDYVK